MRFLCSIACVLALGLAAYATDTTLVAPAAAPEPAAIAAAGPSVTWSGLAMIRLREDIIRNNYTAGTGIAVGSRNYSNRLAYKFGAKIQTNPQVSLMFELGNEWYATELVNGGNTMTAPVAASVSPRVSARLPDESDQHMRASAGASAGRSTWRTTGRSPKNAQPDS